MESWGYMQINLMSPLSPRKKNNPPKDAEFSAGKKQGGGGLSGTPEGVPWAGELGGDSFQVTPPCMGGDTWPVDQMPGRGVADKLHARLADAPEKARQTSPDKPARQKPANTPSVQHLGAHLGA